MLDSPHCLSRVGQKNKINMGKFTDQIRELKWELKKVYDPKNAFESPEVAAIMHKSRLLEEVMEGKEECIDCEGYGGTDCDECGHYRDCYTCNSTGLVEKEEDALVT